MRCSCGLADVTARFLLILLLVCCHQSALAKQSSRRRKSGAVSKSSACEIVTAATGDLDVEAFEKKYIQKGARPVIIRNLTTSWLAHSAWATKDGFLERHGSIMAPLREQLVGEHFDLNQKRVSFREYLTDDAHKDFIQFNFGDIPTYRALRHDFEPVPKFLRRIYETKALTLGRLGTGSGGHRHDENWVAQMAGRKMWILAPPDQKQTPSIHMKPCALLDSAMKLPTGMIKCLSSPGEVIYLPDSWWHATCNLDDFTLGIGGKGSSRNWPDHFHSIVEGDLEALKVAADAGVDLSRGDAEAKHVPIHMAVGEDDLPLVEFLLSQRVSADARSSRFGEKAVHVAASLESPDMLKYLINNGHATVRETDGIGAEPLHEASRVGGPQVVKWLLESRADPRILNGRLTGESPLQVAAGSGSQAKVKLLLEHRADIKAVDRKGHSALWWAADGGHAQLVDLFARRVKRPYFLQESWALVNAATRKNSTSTVELLLKKRAVVDGPGNAGLQPLHWAAHGGYLQIARMLVNHGARADAVSDDGRTPHMVATNFGQHEMEAFFHSAVGSRTPNQEL